MNEHLNPEMKIFPRKIRRRKKAKTLSFDDFTGQEQVIENLKIFVEAANQRGEALDHTYSTGHQA